MGRRNYSRSCANKLEGDWEGEKVQRAVKRYHDDFRSKYIGLRLLLLASVLMAMKALLPQTNIRQMTQTIIV